MIWLADRGWCCTGLDNWAAAVRRVRTAAINFHLQGRLVVHRAEITALGGINGLPDPQGAGTQNGGAEPLGNVCNGAPAQPLSPPAHRAGQALTSELPALTTSQFDLVLNVRFLNRALVPQLRAWVAPGGCLLFATFLEHPGAPPEVRPFCLLAYAIRGSPGAHSMSWSDSAGGGEVPKG